MHLVTRRSLAVLAATATATAGVVATPVAAAIAAPAAPTQQRGLLDPISGLLALLTSAGNVQALLNTFGLTAPPQIAQLLQAANAQQLATLLDGLNAGQLDSALATLTPAQLQALLGRVAPGDLAGVFTLLSPAEITGLVNGGGLTQALAGLQAVLAGITAGTPLAAPVDQLVAQVTALLGATPTADLGRLDALLVPLAPVLATAGLNPATLTGLGTAVTGALASGNPTAGLGAILAVLGGGTAPGGTTTTPGGTTTTPGGTTAPGSTTTTPGGTTTTPGGGTVPTPGPTTTTPGGSSTAPGGNTTTPGGPNPAAPGATPRAKVARVKVAGNRRSARVTLRSPAAAAVRVTGKVGARTAFKPKRVSLAGGKLTFKVKLAKAVRRGGRLTVTVTTVGSGRRASKSVRITKK